MCSPTLVVTAISAVSTVAQGYAAKQKDKYDNSVAQYNTRVQENQATMTANKGVQAENAQRQRTAQLIAQQRAQIGANNISLNSGSASSLIQDTSMLGEMDALQIKSNYTQRVGSLGQQANLTRNQGAAALSAGNTAFSNSILSAGAGFVGSKAVADKWFKPDSLAKTGAPAPISSASWTTLN